MTCTGDLNTCNGDLDTCNADSAVCADNLTQCQQLASEKPRFIDNGDGTVTDTKTGLMWETKNGTPENFLVHCESLPGLCPDVHGVNNGYRWSISGGPPDGTVFTDFLAKLNDTAGGGTRCFAGYCDWRLPNEEGKNTPGGPQELETLLAYTQGGCGDGTGA